MKSKPAFILKISCPGLSGIVAALGDFLADRGCFIKEFISSMIWTRGVSSRP
jgi:formyltetrahydrofolate deformylase